MKPGTKVTAEQVYSGSTLGGDMSLGCGHRSAGIVRGSGYLYYCPTCGTAEESIYSVQARRRYRRSGWGGIFRRLKERARLSPDRELGVLVSKLLVPLIEDLEGRGRGHGHRDERGGFCPCSGEDCVDCDRLDRIRAWVERHAA